jgi:hypothetical protein
MEASFGFRLRGREGRVHVRYEVNEDPVRWGYDLLNLGFDIEVARGFPVVEATVEYPAEGYGAVLGWIQVVRYRVDDAVEPTVVIDVAPQLKDTRMPYLSYGPRPALFDAPAFTEQNVVWRASSFLTATPDALMTPVVEPVCGFCWGYVIRDGTVEPTELVPARREHWLEARNELQARFSEWTFQEARAKGSDPVEGLTLGCDCG